ncbi:hypothetical protein [Streptomyces sp. NPDC018711]
MIRERLCRRCYGADRITEGGFVLCNPAKTRSVGWLESAADGQRTSRAS